MECVPPSLSSSQSWSAACQSRGCSELPTRLFCFTSCCFLVSPWLQSHWASISTWKNQENQMHMCMLTFLHTRLKSTHYLYLSASNVFFLSFLAALHVGCLKMEKRCLISQECVWPVSPAQHRPPWVTWPRRPLLCLSCWLRCKYSNSSSHHWIQAAPGFICYFQAGLMQLARNHKTPHSVSTVYF